jgi:Protein of unknown function (DUF2799)
MATMLLLASHAHPPARFGLRLATAVAAAASLLASCATLNQQECLNANWQQLGVDDGRSGQPVAWLNEHREACAKHGVVPDERAWLDGRAQGLVEYCSLDRALSDGLAGRGYQGVCPPGMDADFARINQAARDVHAARGHVQSLNSQASQLEASLRAKGIDDKRRAAIGAELRSLDRRLMDARDVLRWRERDLDRLRMDLRRGG